MNKKGVKFAALKWWWSSLGPQGLQRQIDNIKGFRPHHESLELRMSIVAKVASKRWGSVTLSPQP